MRRVTTVSAQAHRDVIEKPRERALALAQLS
jgi:hypothetical protein